MIEQGIRVGPNGAPAVPRRAPGVPYGAPAVPYGAPGVPYGAPGLQPRRPSVHLTTLLAFAIVAGACSRDEPAASAGAANTPPRDAQHAGITEPHGDHTPQHGGLVLMNGDVHYELVMKPTGKYEVWFTDAIRTELPASLASNVRLQVTRPDAPPETLTLAIDDAGESWVGQGQPIREGVMVKLTYDLRGEAHEVETPFVAAER